MLGGAVITVRHSPSQSVTVRHSPSPLPSRRRAGCPLRLVSLCLTVPLLYGGEPPASREPPAREIHASWVVGAAERWSGESDGPAMRESYGSPPHRSVRDVIHPDPATATQRLIATTRPFFPHLSLVTYLLPAFHADRPIYWNTALAGLSTSILTPI
jgi:hypothetical protein